MSKEQFNGRWIETRGDIATSSRAVNKPGEYAILPRESLCRSYMPFWDKVTNYVMTSPERGSFFVQIDLKMEQGGGTLQPVDDGLEQFLFVVDGEVELKLESGEKYSLGPRSYAWLPPNDPYWLVNTKNSETRVAWLRKYYEPVPGWDVPARVIGNELELPWREADTHLERHLLPFIDNRAYDMCMKTLYYEPGVYFSHVESHVQEHGLVMMEGRAVYYLNGSYHEVQEGDFIYMAPWCLQMMYATGWSNTAYLLYKEYNRDYISRIKPMQTLLSEKLTAYSYR